MPSEVIERLVDIGQEVYAGQPLMRLDPKGRTPAASIITAMWAAIGAEGTGSYSTRLAWQPESLARGAR